MGLTVNETRHNTTEVSEQDVTVTNNTNTFENTILPQLGMDMPLDELRMYQDIVQKYNMADNVNSMMK